MPRRPRSIFEPAANGIIDLRAAAAEGRGRRPRAFVTADTSKAPVPSKTAAAMPGLKPHAASPGGHPGSTLTPAMNRPSASGQPECRLRRGRRHVDDRDGARAEDSRSIVVLADAPRRNGRTAANRARGFRSRSPRTRRPRPSGDPGGAPPRRRAAAAACRQTRAASRQSPRGVDNGEHARGDRDGDRRGNERLDEGKPRLTPPGRRHGTLLVRMVTNRAASFTRTCRASLSAPPAGCDGPAADVSPRRVASHRPLRAGPTRSR